MIDSLVKKIILHITPQTWFKVLPQHSVFFRIPEKCPKGKNGCKVYRTKGECRHALHKSSLQILKRIRRYNQYKIDVLAMAKKNGFEMPEFGWSLYFYFPMPAYWSKKKKLALHGQHKLSKPDIDNLEKAFYDSLSVTDERVGQISGHGKFWDMYTKIGYIEILLNQDPYNPFGVGFIDQRVFESQPKRAYVKGKKTQEQLFKKIDKIT